jgi:hypothetical protein
MADVVAVGVDQFKNVDRVEVPVGVGQRHDSTAS